MDLFFIGKVHGGSCLRQVWRGFRAQMGIIKHPRQQVQPAPFMVSLAGQLAVKTGFGTLGPYVVWAYIGVVSMGYALMQRRDSR